MFLQGSNPWPSANSLLIWANVVSRLAAQSLHVPATLTILRTPR